MNADEFSAICLKQIDAHLQAIYSEDLRGNLHTDGGAKRLYPNVLVCTQTRDHLIAELFGATSEYAGLMLKQRTQATTSEYFFQFSDHLEPEPMFRLGAGNQLTHICLAHEEALAKEVEKRFPMLGLLTSRLVRANGRGALVTFSKTLTDSSLCDCILVNSRDDNVRAKYIRLALVFSKNVAKDRLPKLIGNHLIDTTGNVRSLTGYVGSDRTKSIASQLQSFFLTPHMHETTIGAFIEKHPEVILKAFATQRFVYEPEFVWINRPLGLQDTKINPDLMIQREDGHFDIVDLKTALLDYASLTKGEYRRRQFMDKVAEGLAQVAHYAEYFEDQAHQDHAKQKYGITVKEPRLYLIVGHHDNAVQAEIKQALRGYGRHVIVLDYDWVVRTYMSAASGDF